MTNSITTGVQFLHTTDADFRAWGLAFSTLLTTIGMTKASDTGQINWATVTRSGVNNTAAGYEIWYNNDTQQGSAPIRVKIEYGQGSGSAVPSIWTTWGTGSDGSGNITGTFKARIQLALTAWSLTDSLYATRWDGGWFIWGAVNITSTMFMIGSERTVNPSTGVPTAVGAVVHNLTSSSSSPTIAVYKYVTATGLCDQMNSASYHPLPGFNSTDYNYNVGTDLYMFPAAYWFPNIGPVYFAGSIVVGRNDFSVLTEFTADTYGGAVNFKVCSGSVKPLYAPGSTHYFCVRW